MRPDIVPGAAFPDYELPDHESTPRRLSDIQGDDPMILTLARGHHTLQEFRNLRDVTREIRPDWDLGAPGLREAWEAGDYASFHGWDRRAPAGTV